MIKPISSTWSLRSRLNNPDTYAVELVSVFDEGYPIGWKDNSYLPDT